MTATALVEKTKKFSRNSRFTDAQIECVAKCGKDVIAEWARGAAADRQIAPQVNQFVRAVSRLSDGVVDLDPVEEILVAMNRAGVISSHQRGLLQVYYWR